MSLLENYTPAKDLETAIEAIKTIQASEEGGYPLAEAQQLSAIFTMLLHLAGRSDSVAVNIFASNIFPRTVTILERAMKLIRPSSGSILPEERSAEEQEKKDKADKPADPQVEREHLAFISVPG